MVDLVERGVITSGFIDITSDLIELNDLFNLYWRRIMLFGQNSSIAFPFSRLDSEPFWELVPQPGTTVTQAMINNTASVSYLRKYTFGALLDDDLFRILQSTDGRGILREALLYSCFSEAAQMELMDQTANSQAYSYSRLLEEKSHLPLVKEVLESDTYRPSVRYQGFRRVIVSCYDHRCALCGTYVEQRAAINSDYTMFVNGLCHTS